MAARHATSTSNFGVGRRESHDSSAFYARFTAPELSQDDAVASAAFDDPFVCTDSRRMSELSDNSVALVVTSPPYFAGKSYEEDLSGGEVPASYAEYLDLLRDVFSECKRVLEPGGRIAVNVANLGRKPFRSLAADVIQILQDDLRLLLRGEIVWQKGEGASGSCAWGSFRSPVNPVVRDVTERIVIASKGRFDRALDPKVRARQGLPHEATVTADEFMAATLDVWEIAPESAHRVEHPAPFPVELPQRLIELYTFANDLVLDPFMGSGSSLVAAARTGRRFIGFDLDPQFVETARRRVAGELAARSITQESASNEDGSATSFRALVDDGLSRAGFVTPRRNVRQGAVTLDVVAEDRAGATWNFISTGALTEVSHGLGRKDLFWAAVGRVLVASRAVSGPVVILTSHLPRRSSEGDRALRALGPSAIFDVVDIRSVAGRERLERYATASFGAGPQVGFWSEIELAAQRRSRRAGSRRAH